MSEDRGAIDRPSVDSPVPTSVSPQCPTLTPSPKALPLDLPPCPTPATNGHDISIQTKVEAVDDAIPSDHVSPDARELAPSFPPEPPPPPMNGAHDDDVATSESGAPSPPAIPEDSTLSHHPVPEDGEIFFSRTTTCQPTIPTPIFIIICTMFLYTTESTSYFNTSSASPSVISSTPSPSGPSHHPSRIPFPLVRVQG
jgi:hypothetical protein